MYNLYKYKNTLDNNSPRVRSCICVAYLGRSRTSESLNSERRASTFRLRSTAADDVTVGVAAGVGVAGATVDVDADVAAAASTPRARRSARLQTPTSRSHGNSSYRLACLQ